MRDIQLTSKPSGSARRDEDEYEFIPTDPAKPIFYGFCKSQQEAADFAEAARCGMYRKILPRGN